MGYNSRDVGKNGLQRGKLTGYSKLWFVRGVFVRDIYIYICIYIYMFFFRFKYGYLG